MPKFNRISLEGPAAGALFVGCGEWGFRDLPMPEHFRIAQRLGFRVMEIGIGGGKAGRLPTRMSDAEIASFNRLRRGHGIATPMCCIENDFSLPDPVAHDAMVIETLEQVKLAARLGCAQVRLFAGFTPMERMDEPTWSRLFDAFRRADALCGRLGLTIAIETHGRIEFVDGAAVHSHAPASSHAGLRRLVRDLPVRVGFNFDPGNLKAVEPADRAFALGILDERINYCHMKDWRRQGAGWVACAIGEDDLDYAALLRQMKYDGCHLVEYEPTHDVEAGIARSLAELERIAKAGAR
ncbi:MAG: sugar phosphate isomerase/epimerase [Planctomycetota bacterium]|nr:sugar phosphate isomerase/epimerase [Planctomycetota bacterium]